MERDSGMNGGGGREQGTRLFSKSWGQHWWQFLLCSPQTPLPISVRMSQDKASVVFLHAALAVRVYGKCGNWTQILSSCPVGDLERGWFSGAILEESPQNEWRLSGKAMKTVHISGKKTLIYFLPLSDFKTGSCTAQPVLEVMIHLPQLPKFWNYRCASPYQPQDVLIPIETLSSASLGLTYLAHRLAQFDGKCILQWQRPAPTDSWIYLCFNWAKVKHASTADFLLLKG